MLAKILMISKPIVSPWDDSAKNIVRSQLLHSKKHSYRVLGTSTSLPPAEDVIVDPIYKGIGEYSPSLFQNLRVMIHGLRARGADIYHYFFAPNKVTSIAGRVQSFVANVKSVQTVCSRPLSFEKINDLLFCDKVIVLSQDTQKQMVNAGVDSDRLRHIRPGIEPLEELSVLERQEIRKEYGIKEDAPFVVFPGDYEFSSAAKTVGDTVPLLAKAFPNIKIVFACRIKREASKNIRDEIKNKILESGFSDRVIFLENVKDMPRFVGSADVAIMPSESLYAKMDVPLVLLEAMSQKVPIVVADVAPLNELLDFGAGLGVKPGSSNELAEAIGNILDNKTRSKEFGDLGAQTVNEYFSSESMTLSIEKVYNEVLGK